jgi:hypothetical protein
MEVGQGPIGAVAPKKKREKKCIVINVSSDLQR